MRSLFSDFANLWPADRRTSLQPLLSRVPFFHYPDEIKFIEIATNLHDCVIIMNGGGVHEIIQLAALGAEHCVQRQRPDFSQELLTSGLMVLRPKAFRKNPMPFFFTGFSPSSKGPTESHMSVEIKKHSQKGPALDKLNDFLGQTPKLRGVADLCIQVADELISNALFSAPVDFQGVHIHQDVNRASEIILPETKKATLFACFSDYRVIVGCEDRYGSFKKSHLIEHLASSFSSDQTRVRQSTFSGAGLGFRYIIENSANFYLYCDRGNRSLVAAGLSLGGVKLNLSSTKHFHLSIR